MERGAGGQALTVPFEGEGTGPASVLERCLVFSLGELLLAVPTARLRELTEAPRAPRLAPLPPLPGVPPWARGVANLRGDVLTVVDLLPLLGRGELPDRPTNRLLVLGPAAGEAWGGLLVEAVHGMTPLPGELAPSADGHPLAGCLLGTFAHSRGTAALLDVDRLSARLAETQRRG